MRQLDLPFDLRNQHSPVWPARPGRGRLTLDENALLSSFGLRSLSRFHREHPCIFLLGNEEHRWNLITLLWRLIQSRMSDQLEEDDDCARGGAGTLH